MDRKKYLQDILRVVVKVGTRVLTGTDNLIQVERIQRLAAEVGELQKRRITTVLVSSGAVGAGIGSLGLDQYPRLIPDRQAVAGGGRQGGRPAPNWVERPGPFPSRTSAISRPVFQRRRADTA